MRDNITKNGVRQPKTSIGNPDSYFGRVLKSNYIMLGHLLILILIFSHIISYQDKVNYVYNIINPTLAMTDKKCGYYKDKK